MLLVVALVALVVGVVIGILQQRTVHADQRLSTHRRVVQPPSEDVVQSSASTD
jgi:flagellar biosynthesis protein FliQ